MISGATYLLILEYGGEISAISKVIFTLQGKSKVTKSYPTDVTYSNGKFLIPLTQADTTALGGTSGHHVLIESQVNFTDKSVGKKALQTIYIGKTLATELVTGNTPSGSVDLTKIKFELDGDVIIAKIEGEIPEEQIAQAVEDYLDEHPIDAVTETQMQTYVTNAISTKADKSEIPSLSGYATQTWVGQQGYLTEHQSIKTINENSMVGTGNVQLNIPTTSDIDTEVATYWNAHKSELKGDKGDDGNDYVITQSDYNAIATVVLGMLTTAESVIV